MEPQEMAGRLVVWISDRVEEADAAGVVFGLSGGVDSSVVAALAKRACPESCLGLLMPSHSDPSDAQDAMEVARHLGVPVEEVHLTDPYDVLLDALRVPALPPRETPLAVANIKPRLRMITLYYFANSMNYLVVGTGNRSEATVGYFTKYGDGGVDILPLANLTKSRVVELARHLGIPERVIAKQPSAGLWKGQTDEVELGVTYADIDSYLAGGRVEPEVLKRIRGLEAASRHKGEMPQVPDF